ncbi:MAG: hypothetical protein WAT23_15790 [Chromatiaceae bacterium]
MKPLLWLLVLTLGFSGCATLTEVKDTQGPASGPTLYGKVTGSVDHIWRP